MEDERPLSGLRVLVTRARQQAAGLAEPLAALGAEVLIAPVIETIEPSDWTSADQAIGRLESYGWLVLTSANTVERFFGHLKERGISLPANTKVAVVGPATAERLAALGITADLVPADYRAEGLVEAFRDAGAGDGWRILLPRAEKARELLPETLRELGATVDVVPVYRTVPATPDPSIVERLQAGEVDIVTFTSPSTVRHFLDWLTAAGLDPAAVMSSVKAASIGPVSSAALADAGYEVPIEASDSTAAGLVHAIAEYAARR